MRCPKGFSLIETLIAIILASIATLALLQVVSTSSRTSAAVIANFDEYQMMGLSIGLLNYHSETYNFNLDEMVLSRYNINNSDIIESLRPFNYTVTLTQKEIIDPMMTTVSGMTISPSSLTLQKIIITTPHEKKSFFRITSGSL
jgi:prepilin-type N-terminal cleavage/methylation domain-containing protein